MQLPPAAIEPPERLIVPEPGLAVAVPPQLEFTALGVFTIRPAGRVSVNATPVSAAVALGFMMVTLTVVVPPGRILSGEKLLLTTAGATTASAALAWFPVKPDPVTLLVTLV